MRRRNRIDITDAAGIDCDSQYAKTRYMDGSASIKMGLWAHLAAGIKDRASVLMVADRIPNLDRRSVDIL